MSGRDLVQLTCQEVVELVTDYRCGAIEAADRVVFEQHLFGCTWCMTYLKQIDRAVELTAQLRAPQEPAATADTQQLAALFRRWKKDGGKAK